MVIKQLTGNRRFKIRVGVLSLFAIIFTALMGIGFVANSYWRARHEARWMCWVKCDLDALNYKTGRLGNFAYPWWRPRSDLAGFLADSQTALRLGDLSVYRYYVSEEDVPLVTVVARTEDLNKSRAAVKAFRDEFMAYLERERQLREHSLRRALEERLSHAQNEEEVQEARRLLDDLASYLEEYQKKMDCTYVEAQGE